MLSTFRTLFVGANARAEDRLRDVYAIELIDQKIRETETQVHVAKSTLASLIADRAVERMIEQQVLQSRFASVLHLLAVGDNHCAVLRRRLASGHQLRLHRHGAVRSLVTDLDKAHAAAGDDRQLRMPAVRCTPGRFRLARPPVCARGLIWPVCIRPTSIPTPISS